MDSIFLYVPNEVIQQYTAGKFASMNNTCLYSQWFKDDENIVALLQILHHMTFA